MAPTSVVQHTFTYVAHALCALIGAILMVSLAAQAVACVRDTIRIARIGYRSHATTSKDNYDLNIASKAPGRLDTDRIYLQPF
eukprot:5428361-Pleurochrysis_carterae.AAC.2